MRISEAIGHLMFAGSLIAAHGCMPNHLVVGDPKAVASSACREKVNGVLFVTYRCIRGEKAVSAGERMIRCDDTISKRDEGKSSIDALADECARIGAEVEIQLR